MTEYNDLIKSYMELVGKHSDDEEGGTYFMDFSEISRDFENSFMMNTIQFETISEDAVEPKYVYPSDSGFDLYSTITTTIEPFDRVLIPTGLKLSFSDGFEIQIRPKSGLAIKTGLTVLNTPGTVDQGYTGEIQVIVFNTTKNAVTINKGTKIAQAVLCPVISGKYVTFEKVNRISDKDRGENGFGSTGV